MIKCISLSQMLIASNLNWKQHSTAVSPILFLATEYQERLSVLLYIQQSLLNKTVNLSLCMSQKEQLEKILRKNGQKTVHYDFSICAWIISLNWPGKCTNLSQNFFLQLGTKITCFICKQMMWAINRAYN